MKSKASKKVRRLKPPLLNVARTMGKWMPQDDYLLIQSVLHLENMRDVYHLTKFSADFTLKELEDRWFAVLYDAPISKMIYSNISKLHCDDILRLKRQVPMSQSEDAILLRLNSEEKLDAFFDSLLRDNRIFFFEARQASCLRDRWLLFRKLRLLSDQLVTFVEDHTHTTEHTSDTSTGSIDTISQNKYKEADSAHQTKRHILDVHFNRVEESLHDAKIMQNIPLDDNIEREMNEAYNLVLQQIKHAEADVFLWQVLADKCTGDANPFAEADMFALIFCEHFTYCVKSDQVRIGRATPHNQVDIDLSTHIVGAHSKSKSRISRLQCVIRMFEPGDFALTNGGKLTVFVDGTVVPSECKVPLRDKSLIQIEDFSMLFLVNFNTVLPNNASLHRQLVESGIRIKATQM